MELFLHRYKSNPSLLSEYYDKDKGRAKDFSLLLEKFKEDYDENYKQILLLSRKSEKSTLMSKIGLVKDKLDTFTHVLARSASEEDVKRIARD